MDVDFPQTALGKGPSVGTPAGADAGTNDREMSVDADGDLITESIVNMLAGDGPDWRAITGFPTWAESGTRTGDEAAVRVNRPSQCHPVDGERRVVMVRFMQELRDLLARWGPK